VSTASEQRTEVTSRSGPVTSVTSVIPATTVTPVTVSTTADDAPRWLDETEMAAWRGYIETLGTLAVVLEADLAPHGLTMGDYEVLVRLSEAPEHQMRMCDLALQLRLSPSGLTRRLDGLVKGRLVRREPSGQDRRVMLATLTPKGMTSLTQAAPDHVVGVRRHFIDRLTCDEVTALASAFTKIRDAFTCPASADE
jgi:DNA-binding MarR family transcriptional regulator